MKMKITEKLCAAFEAARAARESHLLASSLAEKRKKSKQKIIIFLLNFLFRFFLLISSLETLPETRKSVVISFIYEIIFYRFFFLLSTLDSSSCAIIFFRLFSLSSLNPFHSVSLICNRFGGPS